MNMAGKSLVTLYLCRLLQFELSPIELGVKVPILLSYEF